MALADRAGEVIGQFACPVWWGCSRPLAKPWSVVIRNNPVKRLGGMDVHSRINQGDVPSRQIEMDGRGMLPATGHTGRHIADEKGAIGTEFCCYAFELDWR